MHTPTQDINQLPEHLQEPLIVEDLYPDSIISINPEKIPLINGNRQVSLDNGEILELTKEDKISQHQDQLLLEKEGKFYLKESGSEVFKVLELFKELVEEAKKDNPREKIIIEVNHESFKKYGKVFAHFYQGYLENAHIQIDKKIYKSSIDEEKEFRHRIGGDDMNVGQIKDKLYSQYGEKYLIFQLNEDIKKSDIGTLTLFSEKKVERSGDYPKGVFLKDGTPVQRFVHNGEESGLEVGEKTWENRVKKRYNTSDNNSLVSNGHPHIFDSNKVYVNDKLYYETKKNPNDQNDLYIKKITLSPAGKHFILSQESRYSPTKRRIIIGEEGKIHKEIDLKDHEYVQYLNIFDLDHYVYLINKRDQGYQLYFNGYPISLDIENVHKNFNITFEGPETILLSYQNTDNELIHQKISLNPHAEAIQKDKETREKNAILQTNLLKVLTENGVQSVEELVDALRLAQEFKTIEGQLHKAEAQNTRWGLVTSEQAETINKLKNEILDLKISLRNEQQTIADINQGITEKFLGVYSISTYAKKLLGLPTKKEKKNKKRK